MRVIIWSRRGRFYKCTSPDNHTKRISEEEFKELASRALISSEIINRDMPRARYWSF